MIYGMMRRIPTKYIFLAMAGLALLGFLDSTFLTIEHYVHDPSLCSPTGSCSIVLSSPYSVIFGIPTSLLGVLYYLGVFVFSVVYVYTQHRKIGLAAAWLTLAGFLASFVFVYIQLFVIHAICPYCMVSAATSTALFAVGMHLLATRLRGAE